MTNIRTLATAVAESAATQGLGQPMTCVLGTWLAAESADANLSQVSIAGQTIRFLPKLSGAGTLTAGQTVLLGHLDGRSMVILGAVLGNTQLATH